MNLIDETNKVGSSNPPHNTSSMNQINQSSPYPHVEPSSKQNSYLPDFRKVSKFLIWTMIVVLVIATIYLSFVSISSLRYSPERIVKRFVSLIENPTQTVTETEKQELQAITQSGFFSDWGNENNIKTLRRVSQGNPVIPSEIEYTGQSRRTAQSRLRFDNDLQNPRSKEAILYLERYGTILSGIRWQIFKIDMPREDNPLDGAQNTINDVQENLNEGTQNILDRVRNWFGSE